MCESIKNRLGRRLFSGGKKPVSPFYQDIPQPVAQFADTEFMHESATVFAAVSLQLWNWRKSSTNIMLSMTVFTGTAVREVLWVTGDTLPVIVVLDRRPDGLFSQNGAVQFMGGQTVQRLSDRLIGELKRFGKGLSLDKLGCHRTGCDSGTALLSAPGCTDWRDCPRCPAYRRSWRRLRPRSFWWQPRCLRKS